MKGLHMTNDNDKAVDRVTLHAAEVDIRCDELSMISAMIERHRDRVRDIDDVITLITRRGEQLKAGHRAVMNPLLRLANTQDHMP